MIPPPRLRFNAVPELGAALAIPSLPTVSTLEAQAPPLVLPKQSPRASASQTVGLTDITIAYGRLGRGTPTTGWARRTPETGDEKLAVETYWKALAQLR